MQIWASIVEALEGQGHCALVSVAEVRGSTPREPGARIVVGPDGGFRGTIGGGELEWQAIAAARAALHSGRPSVSLARFTLGPDLGQCCGGTLRLLTEVFDVSRLTEVRALAARGIRQSDALVAIGRLPRVQCLEPVQPQTHEDGRDRRTSHSEHPSDLNRHHATPAQTFDPAHLGRGRLAPHSVRTG